MKRAIIAIVFVAAIHCTLTWYVSNVAMERTISGGIRSLIGNPLPARWFDPLAVTAMEILWLPTGLLFQWLSNTTGSEFWDGILFWSLMVLNSVLWGTAAYYLAHRINSLFWCRRVGRPR